MTNGKQKGASFEREICGALSLWISNGKDKDVFWRSAMSGGRATVALKSGDTLSHQAGDLSAIHPLGHKLIDKFEVECKFYKDLEVQNLIFPTNTGLSKFWEILVNDCKAHQKLPILIAKQNRYPELVCLNKEGAKLLGISLTSPIWRVHVMYADMYVCFLKEFLETASPNRLGNQNDSL